MRLGFWEKAGPNLTDHDLGDDWVIAVLEDFSQPIDSFRHASQVIDDERGVEEKSHVIHASGPESVVSERRARTQSTTISDVDHSG